MSSNSDKTMRPEEPDDDNRVTIVCTDLKVGASGRVTIPDSSRSRYGIEPGDYIDAVFEYEKDEEGDA